MPSPNLRGEGIQRRCVLLRREPEKRGRGRGVDVVDISDLESDLVTERAGRKQGG